RGTPRRAPPKTTGDAVPEAVAGRPDAAVVLRLQRSAGNGAVSALMSVQRTPGSKAEELGIGPGSPLDTPRGRANRAEQMRRAAEYSVDEHSMQGGRQPSGTEVPMPQPDARARARAADYVSVYLRWDQLGPEGRRDELRNIINAQLAREGIPPVRVAFSNRAPGSAVFTGAMWTMALSQVSVDGARPSAQDFATLVDNAVHETQHTVTTFRGVRVAMERKQFDKRSYVQDDIVEQAKAANRRRSPSRELDQHAQDEAFEIYQLSVASVPVDDSKLSPGQARREEVLGRRDAALAAFKAARSEADRERARLAYAAAHNDYMSLPEETFSWRSGGQAKSAVIERITLEEQLSAARARALALATERRARQQAGDQRGVADAVRQSQEELRTVTQLRAQLVQLTSREAKLVGGRLDRRGVPLTPAEIRNAPRAAALDPSDAGRPAGVRSPRPTESTPVGPVLAEPGGKDAAKAAAVVTPGPQPQGTKRNVVAAPGGGIGTEWVKEHETTAGGTTRKTEKGGGFTVGGDTIAGVSGRSSGTTVAGDTSTTVGTTGGVGLTKHGLEAKVGKTEEVTHGVDAQGLPITSSKSTSGGVTLTDQGLGANVGHSRTDQAGTTRSVTGGVTVDAKGNSSVEAGYGMSGKSGSGVKTTFRAGHQVDAGDPVEVSPGVFEVTYSVSDTRGVGVGGSASRTPTGPSVGATVGTSTATTQTGVRRFTSKAEAVRFTENAAALIALGGSAQAPTSVEGALAIPVGETRGSGESEGSNWGVSASYGATVGYGQQKSTSHQLAVRRVSKRIVDVTAVVSRDKVKDWSIAGGITNVKGSSTSSALSVTLRFDLGTEEGRAAFETYTKTGVPLPGSRLMSVTESKSAEEHDRVEVGPLGQAQWTGRTFESKTSSDSGVSTVFGGEQAHDQTPGRVGRWLGEDELHSSAVLNARQENGRETGYDVVVKIRSDSGEYNREQFGQIFMGAQKGKSTATPSGEWTLSAEISKEVVHELEANSSRFRKAASTDERMRILSEVFKENGARAAGGMVRSGGRSALAWTLELKGDANFPGAAGRQRLKDQQKKLDGLLLTSPDAADDVVREAKETMDKLQARRREVSRQDKYTDLPGELRQQQIALIDDHLRDFRGIHERALKAALKTGRGESADATRAKLADPRSYADLPPDRRAADRLRDRTTVLQNDIDTTRKQIFDGSKAVHRGAQSVASGVTSKQLNEQTAAWKAKIAAAFELDKRQMQLKATSDQLREAWNSETTPKGRLEKLRALAACLDERLTLMRVQLFDVQEAAAAIKPITTPGAMAAAPEFWASISGDDLSED
ncbi:MAG: hypothetical protein JNM77_07210, partial [Pseudonocardia sp.]|nr:hypothetical protein [Pseudonocardia sp.]